MPDRGEMFESHFTEAVIRFDDADSDGRTLVGLMVPWDTPAWVERPVRGWESYRRGALTRSLTESKRPIPLLSLHAEAGPVGKLVHHRDDASGHYGTFRLFDTAAARDAAELVREGVWASLSIGGRVIPARTRTEVGGDGETRIVRSEIKLDHVGLVRTPAFEDARVLSLRHEDERHPFDATAVVAARRRRRAHLLG